MGRLWETVFRKGEQCLISGFFGIKSSSGSWFYLKISPLQGRRSLVHKNNDSCLYAIILCSLPKTVLSSSSESLIITLAGSKGRYYFPILQVRKLSLWDAKRPTQGHSVKLQSCDYKPSLHHTELIKGLWKRTATQTGLVSDKEKSHWLDKKLQREQICQLERQKQEAWPNCPRREQRNSQNL